MIDAAERVRVFLDFDGTLAPICARPEQVRLSDGTRSALERLARYRHVSVAIVSGRRRGDLIGQMRLPQVACWGLFGWERRDSCSLSRGSRFVKIAGAGHSAYFEQPEEFNRVLCDFLLHDAPRTALEIEADRKQAFST